MDHRLEQVPAVVDLAADLADEVTGLYVGGSVASGDYRPGVSDIDAVALVERVPDRAQRDGISARHRQLVREVPGAAALHCVYVARPVAQDPARRHWTWAFDELFRRPLSGIARAELLADPVVVCGPAPSTWLPPLGPDDIRAAARAELTGYWRKAVRKRAIWEQDVYVDHGVTTVARADLTIDRGRLVTKSAALSRLLELGLPADIVDGVVRRRAGESVPMAPEERSARAAVVRRFVAAQIERLGEG
ncbi:MAG TPA: nucleotidyltransferase domain-containing protein [Lapillicoccus sp.]|nr:nucleotidyltransferase domain-containing protein [Lapillicoccus sp.]